jgi:DNA polymerase III delta prime subunit
LKYRPTTIKQLFVTKPIAHQLEEIVKTDKVLSMLFHGSAGIGKTTAAAVLIEILGREYYYINGSLNADINVMRNDLSQFVSSQSWDGQKKIVVIDECLDENELVRIGTVDDWKSVKLKDLNKDQLYPAVSFNMLSGELENDNCSIISDKIDDVYEVELDDGRTVHVTANHPFIIEDSNGNYIEKTINDGLNENDKVITIC